MPKFYGELKVVIDELEMHQPTVTDATILRRYRQNLVVSVSIWLEPFTTSQVRGQILGGDSMPTLTTTFSRVMRVSSGADVSSASSSEHPAMISGRDRGRGRDRNFGRGHGFV